MVGDGDQVISLDIDTKYFLHQLEGNLLGLKDDVAALSTVAALNQQSLASQDKHLEGIEDHLKQINGCCKAHTQILSEHDKRVALLEAHILIAATELEARRVRTASQLEDKRVATAEALAETAKTRRPPVDLREDWWKFLMVLAALAAGLGPQIIGKLL